MISNSGKATDHFLIQQIYSSLQRNVQVNQLSSRENNYVNYRVISRRHMQLSNEWILDVFYLVKTVHEYESLRFRKSRIACASYTVTDYIPQIGL